MEKNFIKLNENTIVNASDVSAATKEGLVFSIILKNGQIIQTDFKNEQEADKTIKYIYNLLVF